MAPHRQSPQSQSRSAEGGTEHRKAWCGICEAACGLIATVTDGNVESLRPDNSHPASKGFACSKGIAWPAVLADPQRVVNPLRRAADGEFVEVGWDEALDDIGRRLKVIIAAHGRESLGVVEGNPVAANYSAFLALTGMAHALGTKHFYSAASVDIFNYWTVNQILYGNNLITPIPDFARTDLALVLGANPVVSHGSMGTIGNVEHVLRNLVARGGRLVVVDPRLTETAKVGEHLPIRPGGDVWFVAALLKVVLRDGPVDRRFLTEHCTGVDMVERVVANVDVDRAAAECGIDASVIETLAHDLAAAPRAVIFGRCGASLGRYSTLTKYLLDCLTIVTGNLDRLGGMVFAQPYLDAAKLTKLLKISGYDRWRTRVDGHPEVFGQSPLATLATEMTTPGRGQLRAIVAVSSNFAMTAPASQEIRRAIGDLDLFVSLDPYVTDTNRYADYILPPTLMLERDGMPVFAQLHALEPNIQWVDRTVQPPGNTRDDSWIIEQICRRIGLVPSAAPGAQLLGKIGVNPSMALTADLVIRVGAAGDFFGLRRGGFNRRKLMASGTAYAYADHPAVGVLRKRVLHRDKRVHLAHPVFQREMHRLLGAETTEDSRFPLRLFTIREYRSQNSWLHNVPKLMAAGRTCRLRIHPHDAYPRGLTNGSSAHVRSAWGDIVVAVEVTGEVMPGSVGMPAHWGHSGGWTQAVNAGGGNYNDLTCTDPKMMDVASGQAWLNGIAVEVSQPGGAMSAANAGDQR